MIGLRPANRRLVVSVLLLAPGCSSVQEPPGIPSAHPASAEAAESPRTDPLSILGGDSEEARGPNGHSSMGTGPRNDGHRR